MGTPSPAEQEQGNLFHSAAPNQGLYVPPGGNPPSLGSQLRQYLARLIRKVQVVGLVQHQALPAITLLERVCGVRVLLEAEGRRDSVLLRGWKQ